MNIKESKQLVWEDPKLIDLSQRAKGNAKSALGVGCSPTGTSDSFACGNGLGAGDECNNGLSAGFCDYGTGGAF
jgi:hypothetical protein